MFERIFLKKGHFLFVGFIAWRQHLLENVISREIIGVTVKREGYVKFMLCTCSSEHEFSSLVIVGQVEIQMKYKICLLNLKLKQTWRKLQVWRIRRLEFKAIWIVWEMAWKTGWMYKVLCTGIINSTYTETGAKAWATVIWKKIRKLGCH